LYYGCHLAASFPNRTLKEGILECKILKEKINLEAIEIGLGAPELFRGTIAPRILPWDIDSKIKREILDLVKCFKIKGAHLPTKSLGIYSISTNSKIEKVSKNIIKEGIIKSAELELDYALIHLDAQIKKITYKELWNLFEQVVCEYLEVAEDYGIVLTIENSHINLIRITQLVKKINSPFLRITLDVEHAFPLIYDTKYGSFSNFIKEEGDFIESVHISDHNLQEGHLLIGEGVIDFSEIIYSLKEIRYAGAIIVENGPKTLSDIAYSIERLRSYEANEHKRYENLLK